jgi:acetyl/propionyl-CoA carboxylase alpha subunit/acetyl-CoA carboxylase carboxyltransferase component
MRCLRTVKALRAREGSDLRTVALYTDSDRNAPFVRHADAAVELSARNGEVAAYLDHDRVMEALERAGADSVWPGWGFLAEDPAFADRVVASGLCFLGPSGAAMRVLGDKIAAKQLAEKAGVPVSPWSGDAVSDERTARAHAARLGYPVLIKAAAGGGGRGMRIVGDPDGLAPALASASSEAKAAFGDARLFLERIVQRGRHIEVQIVGDLDGHVIALGCRDCSVQRRHQKVIEEAPPPNLSRELLTALSTAAVRMAREVGYAGAGTVEFLVAPEGFYFLEVNPRLQVEHVVTEAVIGLDLVELQIRIARGESLAHLEIRESAVAIEARLCAEDPDADFSPAPGRIARFDPPLGLGVRVDTGVVAGTRVPAVFDSLIAKVIATGDTREEARARLACALRDLDVVIEGGATNKGFLIDVLDSAEFRTGGVDTGWLDRRGNSGGSRVTFAVEALLAASIIAYQRARHAARLNFYADTTHMSPARVPPSIGQEIDLCWNGASHRLHVFATGSWRYRIQLDGRTVTATWHQQDAHLARLALGERTCRISYDANEIGLRLEVEGHAHRFGWQNAGHVRAGTPAVVVAIQVEPGDRVEVGEVLGLLEAMKIEIPFRAPLAGKVTQVIARKGQQVAAGDVLLVIDPSNDATDVDEHGPRLQLPEENDALAAILADTEGGVGTCPSADQDRAPTDSLRKAVAALREEVRRVLLGFDASAERCAAIVAFLEAPRHEDLPPGSPRELAELRHELAVFADVEELFLRSPRPTVSGELGPSNDARLRMYLRRIHAGGAGIAEEFLALLRSAFSHYGVYDLAPSDALERAALRLFASQQTPELRHRVVLALLRRLVSLARTERWLEQESALGTTLSRIEAQRSLVGDAVADAAIEARYAIFEGPRLEARIEEASLEIEPWLAAVTAAPVAPPRSILRHLADAPRNVFDRVGCWISDADPRRRAIALAAHLHRLYAPACGSKDVSFRNEAGWLHRLELSDGRIVIGAATGAAESQAVAFQLLEISRRAARSSGATGADALEVLVFATNAEEEAGAMQAIEVLRAAEIAAERVTISILRADGHEVHRTFTPASDGALQEVALHGLHPETAKRIDLARLGEFELERLPGADGVYCFLGRSHSVPADERVFVLAEVRRRSPDDGPEASLHVPSFERAFHEATRTLRTTLCVRDPRRRLQWNRIALFVAPCVLLDPTLVQDLARRLAPATRHLGLEKVVVRLRQLDPEESGRSMQEIEFVISERPGGRLEITTREPRHDALTAVSDYERKVVEARRRRVLYPYEIVRLLTEGSCEAPTGASDLDVKLPLGRFEEYDLDPMSPTPRAISVAGRAFGSNACGLVIGIISTPTDKVPVGMRRVLILSDPTISMGSLAAPECDRAVAAIDLAEQLSLPVEWVPVSSGARIAMDSGTENLDATARVVRRIVEFTRDGGTIHIIVHGVNVGAQSYWNALATMGMHSRGALIMTPGGSMVLTGRAALEASGSVAAEDELAIGGFERIMGPNGEAQYFAADLVAAYQTLYEHYRYTYVVPGERQPRQNPTLDLADRAITDVALCEQDGEGFRNLGEVFDPATNPGRKRPFSMRALMRALIDQDGGSLERWRAWVGAETAIVWDAHLGGTPVALIGIESRNVPRAGYRPLDGPSAWNGGTLFPLSSKKVARALRAASGNRPVVILANLAGFDGSPESMRKLQLEYGAEIARAVVEFDGPILFAVVARYHGGAYVVFSKELQPRLHAAALRGSHASVIGGSAAAAVVLTREVRARAASDPRVEELRRTLRGNSSAENRDEFERAVLDATLAAQRGLACHFDAIHTVERAVAVGSIDTVIEPERLRPHLIERLREVGALE